MKIVNLQILGHPINIAIIILMIVVFWFALYTLSQGGGLKLPNLGGSQQKQGS